MYHRLYDYLEQFKVLHIPYNLPSMRKHVRPPMTFFVSLGLSASQLITLNLAVEYLGNVWFINRVEKVNWPP